MAPITASIEISRPPEDVWAYVDDMSRHPEWQAGLLEVRMQTEPPARVGTRAIEKRQVPGGAREFLYEITEYDPPRRAAFRVLDGPVRPFGAITISPLDGGRSRVSFEIEFVPHGLGGKILAPLARRDTQKSTPRNLQALKEKLESG